MCAPLPHQLLRRVGTGVRVKVEVKVRVGVQSGQHFPLGAFGAQGPSGTFGAHGLMRLVPLATNCWPEAARRGRGGVCVLRPAEPPPDMQERTEKVQAIAGACCFDCTAINPGFTFGVGVRGIESQSNGKRGRGG